MDGFGGGSDGLSQKQSVEWNVTTRLLSIDQIPEISLRLDMQVTESCPD